MPITPPFFAHGGILCAANRNEARIACDTDITANTLADIFVSALFFYLVRQKRVCNGRARRADEIKNAAFDGRDHAIG